MGEVFKNFLCTASKWIVAAFCVVIGFLFGEMNGMMWALIVLMLLDYASRVWVAIVEKKLSSAIGSKGIAKKIIMLLIVAVANIVDINVIGTGHVLKSVAVVFYIANEAISLLENGSRLGVPLPKKLVNVLVQLREKSDSNAENIDVK